MALYEKLTFELEFITPAFIGGAFPDEEAELRPASFIGILRWWFRNLALTVTSNIDVIYNLESELFGNTQKAGKIWVRFDEIKRFDYEEFFDYLRKQGLRLTGDERFALSYLGFGNFQGTRNLKAFIPAGEKTRITFLVPKKYLQLIENFLYLVSQLGTLGGRNRRGWGSFFIQPVGGKEFFNPSELETKYSSFEEELKSLIKSPTTEKFQTLIIYRTNFKENYPLKALANFGKEYRRYRAEQKSDSRNLKSLLLTQRVDEVIYNRSWFGLPILNSYVRKNKRKKIFVNLIFRGKAQRLASPMLLKVFRDSSGKYDILISLFRRPFMDKRGWKIPGGRVVALPYKTPVYTDKDFDTFVVQNFLKKRLGIQNPLAILGG